MLSVWLHLRVPQTLPIIVTILYQFLDISYTVQEAQKQQLNQPQTPILFWPSNILAMVVVISWEGLSFEE